jgi:HK97 family phage major capsid protein
VKANNLLTVGTGTVVPNGIVTASSAGVTGGTAVSGAFTADNLIDLAHSVDGAYVRNGAGWMMNRSTIGAVRKLKDGSGRYLFEPAATVGAPDVLLSAPIYDNPDVASVATGAKSVLFGGLRNYMVRIAGGLEIARSEDAYFASDEIGVRATLRLWGDIGQSAAIKYFVGNAS